MNIELLFNINKSKTKDALRLALQSSVAAVATFIVMNTFKIPEVFLGYYLLY